MRYATIPTWIYVMLIVMGLGFGAGAFGFILFVPQPAGTIVGAVWLVMGAGMVFFSYRALAGRGADERIARSGSPATATLLSARATGWTINNVPQWVLRLRIDGYGAPYETTFKMLTYTPPADGESFAVRIDPARREHVVLAPDDATSGGTTSPASAASAGVGEVGTAHDAAETVKLLAELDRMRAAGTLGQTEFDALKRKLLGDT